MKEKILAQLKIKYQNLGFTDKAFEGVAAFLATTTTDEANIETTVSGVDALLKAFQGDVDSRVNTAIEKTKKELTPPGPGDPPKEPNTPPANETPTEKLLRETLAAITDQNVKLAERLEKIETGGAAISRKTALETALKDAPASFKALILGQFETLSPLIKDEAAYTAWFDKVTKTDLDAFNQTLSTEGVKSIVAPVISAQKVTDGKSTTFAESLKGAIDATLEERAAK